MGMDVGQKDADAENWNFEFYNHQCNFNTVLKKCLSVQPLYIFMQNFSKKERIYKPNFE
jgi:hypothetical protein